VLKRLLLVISLCTLLFFSATPVFAHQYVAFSLTATSPDPQTVLDRAQDAVNFANGISAAMGIILAFIALITGILSFLGFSTYRDIRTQTKELSTSIEKMRRESMRSQEAFMYISLGDRFSHQGDTRAAIENYRLAVQRLPEDIEVNYALGLIFSNIGAYDDAIHILEIGNKSATESGHSVVKRAQILKELGLAYRRRGEKLQDEDDYAQAEKYLKDSILLNSIESDTYACLGGLYRRQGKYKLAYEYYQEVFRLNPNSTYALGNLGSLSWYLGNAADAKDYFTIAETLARFQTKQKFPDTYWAYYDLALAQLALGKVADANKTYKKAIALTPGVAQFDGVLSNLKLLQQSAQKMAGLDDIVQLMGKARDVVSI
jgi:Tfp pilus assembly protein PilF